MRAFAALVLFLLNGCAQSAGAPSAAPSAGRPSTSATSPADEDMTTDQLRAECDRGARGACFLLAGRYKFGAGDTPKDPVQSVHYHERSCHLGVREGCVQLGYLYVKGFGVTADPARAFSLFSDACSAQHANGCDSLGEAYEKGWGGTIDPHRARESYAKACQLDSKLCR